MIPFRLAGMALLVAVCSGCTYVPRIVNEYKIDVQQGNVLTQDMVSQLKPGLTKDQVRFILGTPVLTDMFHAHRWDYIYRLRKGNTAEVEMRKFAVFFDTNDKLVRVSGDVEAARPSDASVAQESRTREIDLGSVPPGTVASPPEEKGYLGSIWEKIGF